MLAKQLCLLFATLVVPVMGAIAAPPVGSTSRWATFDASGTSYFAVSIQPDSTSSVPLAARHEVVVLVDTSASQTGPVRVEGLEVVEELLAGLPTNATVSLVACDVKAVPYTKSLASVGSPELQTAFEQLKRRVPLGLTNLSAALRTALSQFSSQPDVQRTIVYVGDGVNRKEYLNVDAQKALLNELIGKQVTVSSFVIGPVVDVPTLAALSNQTGGVLLSRSEVKLSMQEVGSTLAESVHVPVLWPTKVEKPAALANHLPVQFPPLRMDRDSVIVGRLEGKAEAGKLVVDASVAGKAVTLRWNLTPEESHPDMAFLPSVCDAAAKDEGRTLPALGSQGLRAMSYVMFDSSVSMVKAAEFALKSGEIDSALRIAEEALKLDPNNAEALSLLDAAKAAQQPAAPAPKGKLMSFTQPPADDPFGTAPTPTKPGDDPFGTAPAAEPPAAGADPFSGEPAGDAPAMADPAAPAAPAPAMTPDTSDALAPLDAQSGILDSRHYDTGDLLKDEENARRRLAQAVESQVNSTIARAKVLSARDPIAAKGSLMALLEELEQNVNLDPGIARTLDARIRTQLQTTSEAEARYLDRVAREEAVRSQAAASQRLLAEAERRETALKQLVESFNFVMSQGQYLQASQELAPEIESLAPNTPLATLVFHESSLQANTALLRDAFRRREQGWIDSMRGVEEAAVPFAGVPPIVYPPADVWNALSARRKEKYGSINLAADESEERIYRALREQTEVEFQGISLQAVMDEFATRHGIDIYINPVELDNAGQSPDAPVNLTLGNATLRSALRIILKPLDLTYVIREGVLEITSNDDAEREPVNKIYPVGDLVVPPINMGGGMMGGMGGMGGGMGGMGGGMGGMGGGMGGMGGGMGGMGGGMGMGGMGGQFAVPDDVKKSAPTTKSATQNPATKAPAQAPVAKSPAVKSPAVKSPAAKPAAQAPATAAPVAKAPTSKAPTAKAPAKPADATAAVAAKPAKAVPATWDDLLDDYAKADEKTATQLDAEVREIVTTLVSSAQKSIDAGQDKAALKNFQQAIDLINEMLCAGHPQPWMYQALSIAMKACDYPKEDIERVMLSSLDFGGNTMAAVDIADFFAKNQMKAEALALLRDTAVLDSNCYEVYTLALPLARELNDVDAIRWTCVGILSKAWPTRYDRLVDDAKVAARATSFRLKQAGRVMEATVFDNQIKEALRRDIVVRVTWSGEAEIAMRVKEPAGTVCSYTHPVTTSGGVLINPTSMGKKASLDGTSEYYVCSQGYAGEYDIILRRLWGKVAGGKATVEILTDYGTPEEQVIVQDIDINEKDALVKVAVKNGHRKEPIAMADLANVHDRKLAMARTVLGQFGGSSTAGGMMPGYNPYAGMQGLLAGSLNNGFPFRGAVGYRPQLSIIPEGANFQTTGVVSADRRYVRISPTPFFSQIIEVFTFNFVSGQTAGGTGTTGGNGAGGIGGGGGGFGNGAGGAN